MSVSRGPTGSTAPVLPRPLDQPDEPVAPGEQMVGATRTPHGVPREPLRAPASADGSVRLEDWPPGYPTSGVEDLGLATPGWTGLSGAANRTKPEEHGHTAQHKERSGWLRHRLHLQEGVIIGFKSTLSESHLVEIFRWTLCEDVQVVRAVPGTAYTNTGCVRKLGACKCGNNITSAQ
jgi:hypothetical protein